jgi:hypothetical protein
LPNEILKLLRTAGIPVPRQVLIAKLEDRWAPDTIDRVVWELCEAGAVDKVGSKRFRHYSLAEDT